MSDRVNEAAEPQTEAGQRLVDPEQQPEWLREGITYALDPDAFTRAILAIEREAAERTTAAVDVERLRVAIRLAHDEIAATDRLSLAIDEPLLIATKYDEMTNAARLSGESE